MQVGLYPPSLAKTKPQDTRREKYGDENPKTLTSMTHMGGILEKRGTVQNRTGWKTSRHANPPIRSRPKITTLEPETARPFISIGNGYQLDDGNPKNLQWNNGWWTPNIHPFKTVSLEFQEQLWMAWLVISTHPKWNMMISKMGWTSAGTTAPTQGWLKDLPNISLKILSGGRHCNHGSHWLWVM